jgi:hypothetical protein
MKKTVVVLIMVLILVFIGSSAVFATNQEDVIITDLPENSENFEYVIVTAQLNGSTYDAYCYMTHDAYITDETTLKGQTNYIGCLEMHGYEMWRRNKNTEIIT